MSMHFWQRRGYMKITDFYNKEYLQSALYQSFRSIGNYIDGLKPSSRKVVYTVQKNNITSKLKSSQLCSKVAEETQYLHGEQSLTGVIVGLARDYTGSNNLNILVPDGNFGCRFVPEPSAARYIYTYKSDSFDKIFSPLDTPILEEQYFEGEKIEYKYYVPILPLILVNGSEGIGNGFAQKILPRRISDIKAATDALLAKKNPPEIRPYFEGFKGNILSAGEDGKWVIEGKFERDGVHKINIVEVPIGYDLKTYLGVLDDLVEKKIIRDYEDNSDDDNFNFTVSISRDFSALSDDEIMESLRLKKICTENYTCIGEQNRIIEFSNVNELLERFIKIRLDFYSKRKKYLIGQITEKTNLIENKVKFINLVIQDSSFLMNKKKKQVESSLKKNELDEIDGSYDYLLKMPIYSLTEEKVKQLEKELTGLKSALEKITKKTPRKMWQEDLIVIE